MILLYTDFGYCGPYVGEMHAVLARTAPGVAQVDLMHDAPAFRPRAAGVLLAALAGRIAPRSTVIGVVDPGVGTPRRAMVARVADRWFVGPDNGLFGALLAEGGRAWSIPAAEDAAPSFHGRDVFAPAAAQLAIGVMPRGATPVEDWVPGASATERSAVIYVDGFGNLITGLTAGEVVDDAVVTIRDRRLGYRRVFAEARPGEPFWYRNSMGLVELATNGGSAAAALGAGPGEPVSL